MDTAGFSPGEISTAEAGRRLGYQNREYGRAGCAYGILPCRRVEDNRNRWGYLWAVDEAALARQIEEEGLSTLRKRITTARRERYPYPYRHRRSKRAAAAPKPAPEPAAAAPKPVTTPAPAAIEEGGPWLTLMEVSGRIGYETDRQARLACEHQLLHCRRVPRGSSVGWAWEVSEPSIPREITPLRQELKRLYRERPPAPPLPPIISEEPALMGGEELDARLAALVSRQDTLTELVGQLTAELRRGMGKIDTLYRALTE